MLTLLVVTPNQLLHHHTICYDICILDTFVYRMLIRVICCFVVVLGSVAGTLSWLSLAGSSTSRRAAAGGGAIELALLLGSSSRH